MGASEWALVLAPAALLATAAAAGVFAAPKALPARRGKRPASGTGPRMPANAASVLGVEALAQGVASFLDCRTALSLTAVSRALQGPCGADVIWAKVAREALGERFLPRLDAPSRARAVDLCKLALSRGFFHGCAPHASWKEFLALCGRSARQGGYGNAVVVQREELRPHHLFRFVHMLSIRKDAGCVLAVLRRFLRLYARLDGKLALRDNVGFCFALPGGGQESVSHKDFMEIARASNLQVTHLLEWFECVRESLADGEEDEVEQLEGDVYRR